MTTDLLLREIRFAVRLCLMLEEEEFEVAEVDFRPTGLKIFLSIFMMNKKARVPVSKVRVYETPESYAEYCED